ncbi:MAG: formylglycine-generating enzyme family protein, partial [Gemmataceae bacterium]|nr:formylglycine-generating enzyme family protein [Gemmataceae bacterium]
RRLLATCSEPDAHPERVGWHARVMELLRAGVEPCVPRHTLTLPGGVELVGAFVPPGSFRMGSPESEAGRDDDEAAHVVTLARGFFVGVYQVTQAQWFSVIGTNPSRYLTDGSEWDGSPVNELWRRTQSQGLPVESVGWEDAVAFCRKLSATGPTVRLPTEAEWEYACRAGTSTPFYWGEDGLHYNARIDWNGSYSQGGGDWTSCTCPVGTYATLCPHPWGQADVHGNVWEWCLDGHDAGHGDALIDRMMARGGSWADMPRHCRAASRYRHRRSGGDDVGFRVVFCLD